MGDTEADGVNALVRVGLACRPLSAEEFGRISSDHVKEWTCWIATDRTPSGYTIAYAGLAINRQGRLMRVGTGFYPVMYRNLRVDEQGRTTVVPDSVAERASQHISLPPTITQGKVIVLRKRPDGTPSLTIAPPATWQSNWEAGEDTRRQYLTGDGVAMTLETWAHEPTWACRGPSCGLANIVVAGVSAKLLRLPEPRSVHAFIPRRGDASGRGVSIWATCSAAESCLLAEQVIASIRGF